MHLQRCVVGQRKYDKTAARQVEYRFDFKTENRRSGNSAFRIKKRSDRTIQKEPLRPPSSCPRRFRYRIDRPRNGAGDFTAKQNSAKKQNRSAANARTPQRIDRKSKAYHGQFQTRSRPAGKAFKRNAPRQNKKDRKSRYRFHTNGQRYRIDKGRRNPYSF